MTLPTLLAQLCGWTDATELWMGDNAYLSPNEDLMLQVAKDGSWELLQFTDSDVAGVATGRYDTVDEGDSLREVPEAIRCAIAGTVRDVEDDAVYEYAEQKGAGMREEGE